MATQINTVTAYRTALGSIVKATTTVGTIFDVASDSVSMLGTFVKEHSQRQQASAAIDREIFLEQLEHDTTIRLAEIHIDAAAYCTKSENHAKFYNSANERVSGILKQFRPSSNQEPSE